MNTVLGLKRKEPDWAPTSATVLIGKDIMELLSSSMYIDPMSIYREYVQNAADAIDDARRIVPTHQGRVAITIDPVNRGVKIRDNGTGISQKHFIQRLTAFGASFKRGTNARGFRGVGRLAGMGYCQQLTFRSRAQGEQRISELHWDCRKLKTLLRASEFVGTLEQLVHETVTDRTITDNTSGSFFEIELQGIIRHRDDALLSPEAVDRYLSQVAPIPFAPDFPFTTLIREYLKPHVDLADLAITINGATPVCRPHHQSFDVRTGLTDSFTELELVALRGEDRPAAIGWFLHHNYLGSLPPRARIGGIRLRCGDIQVGDATIVESVFVEPRFNAWCVGEFHIIDDRIVPNGRRDHFEQNAHLNNLLNQLGPIARNLTHRAREGSLRRKYEREFAQHVTTARQKLAIINQGTLISADQARFVETATRAVDAMERILAKKMFAPAEQQTAEAALQELHAALAEVREDEPVAKFLQQLTPKKRQLYQEMFALVYEYAPNDGIAQTIVGRMLNRLRRAATKQ